ncbi:MAG: Lrp/AsnC family transcriptional regulator [bacterium]|nr:Lrp/AsnC family transcriptional regulator [bacterium]
MSKHDFRLRLIDGWQREFPLTHKPFVVLARELGVGEKKVLTAMRQMQDEGVLTRVGAVVRPNTVGASTLAAMKVPRSRLLEVANIVNSEPGVNHNYEREHEFNLWFVATARDTSSLEQMLQRISARAGIEALSLPLQKAHHIDLGFSMSHALIEPQGDRSSVKGSLIEHGRREGAMPPPTIEVCEEDRLVLAAIEDGLPLVPEPYESVARQLDIAESEVIERLNRLVDGLVISRFGLVVQHRKMGYTANAMAVWDISDDRVDAFGDLLASKPFVTLCYQRIRNRPDWPYNLFCMIHGNERDSVLGQIEELNQLIAGNAAGHSVLFSKNCFKQRGARFSSPGNSSGKQAAMSAELFHA